jgi:hypothetical protein
MRSSDRYRSEWYLISDHVLQEAYAVQGGTRCRHDSIVLCDGNVAASMHLKAIGAATSWCIRQTRSSVLEFFKNETLEDIWEMRVEDGTILYAKESWTRVRLQSREPRSQNTGRQVLRLHVPSRKSA